MGAFVGEKLKEGRKCIVNKIESKKFTTKLRRAGVDGLDRRLCEYVSCRVQKFQRIVSNVRVDLKFNASYIERYPGDQSGKILKIFRTYFLNTL